MSEPVADSQDPRTMRIGLERDPQAPSLARAALARFVEQSDSPLPSAAR